MLKITKEFITPEEEMELLKHIKPSKIVRPTSARNRVIRFGSKVPYNSPMQSKTIPQWIEFLVQRLLDQQLVPERPDHVTINEYQKGQQIDYHIDSKTSGEIITVLSLMSDATMGLKYPKGQEVLHPVPARSLTQMTEKDRWEAMHCIFPVPSQRYSIVFRKGTKI